jgi:hypothetical protein
MFESLSRERVLAGLKVLLELVEVLLSMGTSLGACSRPHILVDLVPILAKTAQSIEEPSVLLVGPPTVLTGVVRVLFV